MPALSFLEYIRNVEVKGNKLILTTTPDYESTRGFPVELNLSAGKGLEAVADASLVVGILDDNSEDNYGLVFFKEQNGLLKPNKRKHLRDFFKNMIPDQKFEYCESVLDGRSVAGYDKITEIRAGSLAQSVKV